MPENSNSEDDLYGASPTPAENQEPEAPEEGQTAEEPEESESTQSAAVLPKSILAGKDFKPGDEIVLKITAIRDDEVVVEYAPAKGSEGKGGGEEAAAPEGGGDGEMAGMMY